MSWQSRSNRRRRRRKCLKMAWTCAPSGVTRWPENLLYSCRTWRRQLKSRKRAVAYFADWVEPRQRDVKTILETLPVLMHSLRWGVKFGMAPEVMRITKSLEFTLVLTGRWESWTNALCLAAQSATAAGDKGALGWVSHQDGTKAICEGNFTEGRQSLERALQDGERFATKLAQASLATI